MGDTISSDKMETRDILAMHEDYCHVDFAARYQPKFRNHIVHLREIPRMIDQYRAFECYTSCFLFNKELQEYVREHGSVAGYDGEVFAYFLPLDIDASKLDKALETVRKILLLLVQDWKIMNDAVQCYFSGSKGFHIMMDTRVFGDIVPSSNLHYVFSTVREIIAKKAKVKIDLTIKDKFRLLRLPNTLHQKSHLYKVQISLDEIMGCTIEKIRDMAKTPQQLMNVDRSGLVPAMDIKPNVMASEVFRKATSMISERKVSISIDQSASNKLPGDVLCDARKEIWQTHIEEGLRHNCAMRIISQFRNSGFSRAKSLGLMKEWNINNTIGLPEQEIRSMVDSVYSSPHPYHYGCLDSILQDHCPYRKSLRDCTFFRRFMAMRGKKASKD